MFELSKRAIAARPHMRSASFEVIGKNGPDSANITIVNTAGASLGLEFQVQRRSGALWLLKWALQIREPVQVTLKVDGLGSSQYQTIAIAAAPAVEGDPEPEEIAREKEASLQDQLAARVRVLMAEGLTIIEAAEKAGQELIPKPARPDEAAIVAAQLQAGLSVTAAAEIAQKETAEWEKAHGEGAPK